MSLSTAAVELSNGLRVMREVWDQAHPLWRDAVARDFESNHWEPLALQVEAVVQAPDHLAPLLARLRRECS